MFDAKIPNVLYSILKQSAHQRWQLQPERARRELRKGLDGKIVERRMGSHDGLASVLEQEGCLYDEEVLTLIVVQPVSHVVETGCGRESECREKVEEGGEDILREPGSVVAGPLPDHRPTVPVTTLS